MFGPSGEIPQFDNTNSMDDNVGLAPRAAVELFNVLEERKTSFDVSVHANMFEVRYDTFFSHVIIIMYTYSKRELMESL
jgi:hypothetical protein